MRTLCTLIILFLSILLLPGLDCRPFVDCPGFSDSLLTTWFPYKEMDSVKFTTVTNKSRTFTAWSVYTSKPMSHIKGCAPNRYIEFRERDSIQNPPIMDIMLWTSANQEDRGASVHLLGQAISAEFREKGFEAPTPPNPQNVTRDYYNSIQLNGKTFTEVQVLTFDTSTAKRSQVHIICIAKGHGVVAWETFNPALLWVKE